MKFAMIILLKLKNFFSSLKLAMVLFILISVVSIIGTIIEQGEPLVEYKTVYGPIFKIFYGLGLFDIYHSWYFITLGGLLVVNLIVCSVIRLPRTLKIVFKPNPSFPDISSNYDNENKSNKRSRYYNFNSSKSKDEVLRILKNIFSRKFGKPKEKYDGNQSELYFSKNGIFRLSPYVVHLGIIVIVAGVILNTIYGFRSYVDINEGLSAGYSYLPSDKNRNGTPVKLPFKIMLNRYTTKFYKDGMPKAYISKLSIIKKHKIILTKSIRVNHPLKYGAFTIYQVSYGHYLPTAARLLLINLNGNHYKKRVLFAEPKTLYNTGIKGLKFEFNQLKNPSVNEIPFYISLYKNKKYLKNINFFEHIDTGKSQKFPLVFAMYKKRLAFMFTGVKIYYYSGLEVAKNAYTWVIWLGSIIMIIALFFSFYFNHKTVRVKIYLSEDGEGSRVDILTGSHKRLVSYFDKIEKTIIKFKNHI